jgi:hypothetical protein
MAKLATVKTSRSRTRITVAALAMPRLRKRNAV